MGEMNRLTCKIAFHIWPALVNKELSKRKKEINPLYKNIVIDNSRADLSEQIDTKLWDLLANENTVEKTGNEIIDGDKDIEENYHFKEEQRALNAEPTVMHNVMAQILILMRSLVLHLEKVKFQYHIAMSQIVKVLLWQICFLQESFMIIATEFSITFSKYIHSMLKNCDKSMQKIHNIYFIV